MTHKEKIIYLAGLIDGEGHFFIYDWDGGKNSRPQVIVGIVVANTNKEIIDWLKENYGGYKRSVTPKVKHWSIYYDWQLRGKAAIALAHLIEPYLIIKREQVKRLTDIKFKTVGKKITMIRETIHK